jgi:Domain of unknown function (DUF6980)
MQTRFLRITGSRSRTDSLKQNERQQVLMSDKRYCCERMELQVNRRCDQHPEPFDCADILIYHSEKAEQYGLIIHDSGSSYSVIQYCPWCGNKLTESKHTI